MSTTFWQPTKDQRRTILLLEVAGLLHDVGKLSDGFLKDQGGSKGSYEYRAIADPDVVFPALAGGVSDVFDKILSNAKNPTIGKPFADRPDITSALLGHSLAAWDSQSYNLAEILLGQYA